MAVVHHFAFGWINPIIAYVMSFLGSLLGLVLTARARQVPAGPARVPWLLLAAVSIGGTGIWLMHFMAMLGFDVPGTTVRYDVTYTVMSLVTAVVIVAVGLLVVGVGRPHGVKVVLGGVFTGLGVAGMHYSGMHYSGMDAMRLGGHVSYEPHIVVLSLAIAVVVAATVALWFAIVVSGPSATVGRPC